MRFSHRGTLLVTTTAELQATVWDVRAGRAVEDINVGQAGVRGVGFSPDDATLYVANEGALRSYDLAGRRRYIAHIIPPTGGDYGCISPAPGGKTTLPPRPLRDLVQGRRNAQCHQAGPLPGNWWETDTGNCVAWHPTGARAATMKSDVLSVWNAQTGELVASRPVAGGRVSDFHYAGRDGRPLAIGQVSGVATLLDSDTLEEVGTPVQLNGSINWLSAGLDGHSAAVLTGDTIADGVKTTGWALLDLEAGKVIRSGRLTLADPEVVALSPDGRHIAVTSAQGEVLVLDTAAGAAPGRPVKVKRGANSLAFSADGSLLVAPGEGTVNLYDGSTGAPLGSVVVPNRTTVTADFRPDGHTVVIASYDDAIYTWDTRIEHTIDYACRTAGRDLTAEEWHENFAGRPYRKTCP